MFWILAFFSPGYHCRNGASYHRKDVIRDSRKYEEFFALLNYFYFYVAQETPGNLEDFYAQNIFVINKMIHQIWLQQPEEERHILDKIIKVYLNFQACLDDKAKELITEINKNAKVDISFDHWKKLAQVYGAGRKASKGPLTEIKEKDLKFVAAKAGDIANLYDQEQHSMAQLLFLNGKNYLRSAKISNKDQDIFVIYYKGNIAGYFGIVGNLIAPIYIFHAYQGKGLGKIVVEKIIKDYKNYFKNLSKQVIAANISALNIPSRKIFENSNFQIVSYLFADFVNPLVPSIRYELKIT